MTEGNTHSDDHEIFYNMLHHLAGETCGIHVAYERYLGQLKELNDTLKEYKDADSVITPDYEPFMKRTVTAVNRFISEYKKLKDS